MSRNLGASASRNPQGLPRPVQDCFTAIRKHNRMPHTKTTIGVCIKCQFFNVPEKLHMHWHVNTIHKLLYVSALLECHHQALLISVKVVPFELVRDCLSILFTFQCIRGWFDKMYFASCTVCTIVKKSQFSFKICPPDSSTAHYIHQSVTNVAV